MRFVTGVTGGGRAGPEEDPAALGTSGNAAGAATGQVRVAVTAADMVVVAASTPARISERVSLPEREPGPPLPRERKETLSKRASSNSGVLGGVKASMLGSAFFLTMGY
jgi:hypothetical protein